jgi:hypothetical protein
MTTVTTCESCGMPIETGRYCSHCADETGALRSFDDRFERMIGWEARRGRTPPGPSSKRRPSPTWPQCRRGATTRGWPRPSAQTNPHAPTAPRLGAHLPTPQPRSRRARCRCVPETRVTRAVRVPIARTWTPPTRCIRTLAIARPQGVPEKHPRTSRLARPGSPARGRQFRQYWPGGSNRAVLCLAGSGSVPHSQTVLLLDAEAKRPPPSPRKSIPSGKVTGPPPASSIMSQDR